MKKKNMNKKIAIFDTSNHRIKVDGHEIIDVSNRKVRDFLKEYEDTSGRPLQKQLKTQNISCIAIDIALGKEEMEYLNLGLCIALIAFQEHIPTVVYARTESLSESEFKSLHGIIKKIGKRDTIKVHGDDFSTVNSELKKLIEV